MATEGPWAVTYQHGSVTIDIQGEHLGDLAWLREFLEPWCEEARPAADALRVRAVRSDRLVETLRIAWQNRRGTDEAIAPLACIRLDTRTVAFEGWSERGTVRLVDPLTDCFFVISGRNVDVVGSQNGDRIRIALLGVIREAIAGAIAASSAVVDLHAAAFASGDRSVVIAGPKRSGKTSLLCHAITSGGAKLLANDRVFARVDTVPASAYGVPTVVSIRRGTLATFPQLGNPSAFESSAASIHAFPEIERDGWMRGQRTGEGPKTDGPLKLTPRRFAARLGAGQVSQAPLTAIVLPELVSDLSGWSLETLPRDVAARRITCCLFGVEAERDRSTFFGGLSPLPRTGRTTPMTLETTSAIERLVATVPVHRCRLGPDVYRQPAELLIRALGLPVP
ncbi:MAG: hypothetical protein AB7Q29_16300 [Vicinamibacterales bacterium]